MTNASASASMDAEPVSARESREIVAASPQKCADKPYKRFDECPSVEIRYQDIPEALRLSAVKSDYFLNESRRITIPLFDADGHRTISKHEMNRNPNEARVQELMVSIRKDGNATDMTGVLIMVQGGPNRWNTLTDHHRVVAIYRLAN